MKKYLCFMLLALMFCIVISAGCGGGGSDDPEQSEQFTDDTGDYDPNEEGRIAPAPAIDLSTITANYTAKNGDVLTGSLAARVKSQSQTARQLPSRTYTSTERTPAATNLPVSTAQETQQ